MSTEIESATKLTDIDKLQISIWKLASPLNFLIFITFPELQLIIKKQRWQDQSDQNGNNWSHKHPIIWSNVFIVCSKKKLRSSYKWTNSVWKTLEMNKQVNGNTEFMASIMQSGKFKFCHEIHQLQIEGESMCADNSYITNVKN